MSERITFSDSVRICPYCKETYQPESESYSVDVREIDCESCGKTYKAWDEFSVMFYAERITGE